MPKINSAKIKRKLEKTNWYTQAADAKPFYFSYPLASCFSFKTNGRLAPVGYQIAVFHKNNYVNVYLDKKHLKKISNYYYQRQLKNKNFLSDLYNNWGKKYVNPYLKIVTKTLSTDLSQLSDQKLLKLFDQFNRIYLSVWDEAIFLDSFDYYGETILQPLLSKEPIKESDLKILLAPPKASFIQQEAFDLVKTKDLKKHQQKYFWIDNDYAKVEPLNISYFRKKQKSLDRQKEKETANWLKQLPQQKNKIIKKYKFSSKFVNTVNFLALMGNFRDARKTYQQMSGLPLKRFAEEFSRRRKLPLQTVENLFYWEITKTFNPKEVQARYSGAFYDYKNNHLNYCLLTGSKGEELNQNLITIIQKQTGLTGRPAYPGIVKGRVKIINGRADFHKMKPGDILVAPNTRPEYVPLMRIAGAIISAEGGITCHAAIVSRELKKPCLVGLQSAVTSLKDNQLVEVDAERGIIKIIKQVYV